MLEEEGGGSPFDFHVPDFNENLYEQIFLNVK